MPLFGHVHLWSGGSSSDDDESISVALGPNMDCDCSWLPSEETARLNKSRYVDWCSLEAVPRRPVLQRLQNCQPLRTCRTSPTLKVSAEDGGETLSYEVGV